eukprot:2103190-Rhodomonas_salina.2
MRRLKDRRAPRSQLARSMPPLPPPDESREEREERKGGEREWGTVRKEGRGERAEEGREGREWRAPLGLANSSRAEGPGAWPSLGLCSAGAT